MTTITTTTVSIEDANNIVRAFAKSKYHANDWEDIAQNAIMAVFNRIDELNQQSNVGGWVRKITRQCAVDHQRKALAAKRSAERTVSLSGDDRDDSKALEIETCFSIHESSDAWNGTPPQVAIAREHRELVKRQLERLPQSDIEALKIKHNGLGITAKISMRAKRVERKLAQLFSEVS